MSETHAFDIWPDGAPGLSRLSRVILEILRAAGINPNILSPMERTEIARILTSRLPGIPWLPISAELLHNPAKLEEALMSIMYGKDAFTGDAVDGSDWRAEQEKRHAEAAEKLRKWEKHRDKEAKKHEEAEREADYFASLRMEADSEALKAIRTFLNALDKLKVEGTASVDDLQKICADAGLTGIGSAQLPSSAIATLVDAVAKQQNATAELRDAARKLAEHAGMLSQPPA